ncbi:hypothetical protein wVul_1455 [Wolbachia endosymbiont of Armadillidium vulgare str. wVulC]|nr:hypothetical protein wVul_1455 [Wolbachia endosymbiont of Armadillidium vulgare str. wVulC]
MIVLRVWESRIQGEAVSNIVTGIVTLPKKSREEVKAFLL